MSEDAHRTQEAAPPVRLTESAAAELRRIMGEQKLDPGSSYLRFGIRGGGCSGFEYVLGFDTEVKEDDELLESCGIRIVADRKSLTLTEGTEIDFEATVMERHFVFTNPQATRTCGCGTSFSV